MDPRMSLMLLKSFRMCCDGVTARCLNGGNAEVKIDVGVHAEEQVLQDQT